jgi:hypothetical protein
MQRGSPHGGLIGCKGKYHATLHYVTLHYITLHYIFLQFGRGKPRSQLERASKNEIIQAFNELYINLMG